MKAGDIVMRSEPFCAILVGKASGTYCANCFQRLSASDQIRCGSCAFNTYCDPHCLETDFQDHKEECQILSQTSNSLMCETIRMILKLILKLASKDSVSEQETRPFPALESHYEEIKQDRGHMQILKRLHHVVVKLLDSKDTPKFEEFLVIYGRLMINGFEICDGDQLVKGWGLYLGPSILDHSCVPNATVSFCGKTLMVRSLVNGLILDWGHLTISYIDLMDTTEMRRKKLEEQYYFHCQCPRCQRGSDNEWLMYSIRCQICSGRPVYVGPISCDQEVQPDLCQDCGQRPSDSELNTYAQAYKEVSDSLESDHLVGLETLNTLLRRMNGLFYPQHRLFIRIIENLFEGHFRRGELQQAKEYALMCQRAFALHGGHGPRHLGVFHARFAQVCERMGETLEARVLYQKALRALECSHGTQHSLAIHARKRLNLLSMYY